MRLTTLTMAASLAWVGCAPAQPTRPTTIEPGQTFSLKAGQSVLLRAAAVHVGVERITADSRCPHGEQCVWAGDATVRVWLQDATGPRQAHELHTASGAVQAVRALGHELRLLRLDPYPTRGRTVAPDEQIATLTLRRAPAADSDR